jgi:hypothetical protein
MDLVWCGVFGALFVLVVALVLGCDRLLPRR